MHPQDPVELTSGPEQKHARLERVFLEAEFQELSAELLVEEERGVNPTIGIPQ